MKRIRAIGVVIDRSRILLMYRKVKGKEYFVFPGGGVEENETVEQAVAREIKEEASLEIEVGQLLYRLSDENSEHYFYLCSYLSGEPKLGAGNEQENMTEENQYRPEWLNIGDLSNTLVYPLEIRDWLIEDLKDGFSESVREISILTTDRRKF